MDDKQILRHWNYQQYLYSKTTWNRYYAEYTLAIENLLERSRQSETTVLALPTLFLIRHSLELAFKMNLIELEQISGIKALIHYSGRIAHILSTLHKEFERQVKLIMTKDDITQSIREDFKKRNDELKSFRALFDKLDNWSYSFRYPVRNDGTTRSFAKNDEINIADIIPAYKTTQFFLNYTVVVLRDPSSRNN